jgi:hypothetical protein
MPVGALTAALWALAMTGRLTCCAARLQILRGDLEEFVSKITWELSNSRSKAIRVLVPALAVLLRNETGRLAFGRHGGVGYLTKLLKLQVSLQRYATGVFTGAPPNYTHAFRVCRGRTATRSCCTS